MKAVKVRPPAKDATGALRAFSRPRSSPSSRHLQHPRPTPAAPTPLLQLHHSSFPPGTMSFSLRPRAALPLLRRAFSSTPASLAGSTGPTTSRAIVYAAHGDPAEVLRGHAYELPALEKSQVRVRFELSAISAFLRARAGLGWELMRVRCRSGGYRALLAFGRERREADA